MLALPPERIVRHADPDDQPGFSEYFDLRETLINAKTRIFQFTFDRTLITRHRDAFGELYQVSRTEAWSFLVSNSTYRLTVVDGEGKVVLIEEKPATLGNADFILLKLHQGFWPEIEASAKVSLRMTQANPLPPVALPVLSYLLGADALAALTLAAQNHPPLPTITPTN